MQCFIVYSHSLFYLWSKQFNNNSNAFCKRDIIQLFSADATLCFLTTVSEILFFSNIAAQTEKFIFQNVAYRAIVHRTGIVTQKTWSWVDYFGEHVLIFGELTKVDQLLINCQLIAGVLFSLFLFWNSIDQSFFQPECPEIPVFFLIASNLNERDKGKIPYGNFLLTYVLFVGSAGN